MLKFTKIKGISILLMILVIVFMMSGLAEAKKVTITWWINPWRIAPPGFPSDKSPDGEDFPKWVSEEFMKLYPEVEVNYVVVGNKEYAQKIAAAIATNTQPDLFKGPVWDSRWAKAGLLEPIDDLLTKEDWQDYYELSLEVGKIDGKHYIWPWSFGTNGMGTSMLLYTPDFEKAGVDWKSIVKKGWTMERFIEVCKKLTWDTNSDGEIDHYAISFGAKDTHNLLNFIYAMGGELTNEDESRVILNSEEAAAGLQFLIDLVGKYKVAPVGVEAMGVYDVIGNFHAHRTSMGFGGPYEIGRISRYLKSGKIEEQFYPVVAPFPHLKDRDPVAYATASGFIMFKQEDPEKKKMVAEFVRFLTNKENTALLESLKYLTARRSVNENLYMDDAYMKEQVGSYSRIMDNYGIPFFGSMEFPYAEMSKFLSAAFESAFSGTKSPQQALDDFAIEANKILEKNK